MAEAHLYEVAGSDETGWGVIDPWGELILAYRDRADAEAHAALLNKADPSPEAAGTRH